MSHIVIHDDKNGVTHYRCFDELPAAVEYLEELHTAEATKGAYLYRLTEVEFEVKSYIKVEIGGVAEPRDEVTHVPASEQEILASDGDEDDDVEYVEAALGPIEIMEAAPVPDYATAPGDDGQGDSRRGLFGR